MIILLWRRILPNHTKNKGLKMKETDMTDRQLRHFTLLKQEEFEREFNRFEKNLEGTRIDCIKEVMKREGSSHKGINGVKKFLKHFCSINPLSFTQKYNSNGRGCPRVLSTKMMFFMFMIRLRSGFLLETLSYLFGIDTSTVSRYFHFVAYM